MTVETDILSGGMSGKTEGSEGSSKKGAHGTKSFRTIEQNVLDALVYRGIISQADVLASAWLLVITGLALAVIEVGRRRRRPLLLSRAALGAAVAVGLSAMWWMPLTRDSDPRQQLATWGVPSFRANLRTLANGKEAVRPGLALLIIVSSVWLAGWSWQLWRTNRSSRPWRLALALGPLVALAFSHWLWSNYPNTVTMLLPVRGIGNWMLIGLLPASLALGRVMNRISTRWGSLLAACVGIALIAGPASQLDTKFIKEVSARKPSAQLETLAAELRTYVPANGRWVMPTDWPQEKQYGVDLPQYWLVGASGRPTMNGFGGDAVTSWDIWVTDHITERSVPDAAMLLRKAGVTHVYTAGDKTGAFFSSQPALFRMVWESTPMRLFDASMQPLHQHSACPRPHPRNPQSEYSRTGSS